jgi:hypothetical protein
LFCFYNSSFYAWSPAFFAHVWRGSGGG